MCTRVPTLLKIAKFSKHVTLSCAPSLDAKVFQTHLYALYAQLGRTRLSCTTTPVTILSSIPSADRLSRRYLQIANGGTNNTFATRKP